jgi:hypothetical protein
MRILATLMCLIAALSAQTAQPRPKGSIHGVVKDTAGLPVAGVAVEAQPVTSFTNDRGEYLLANLPEATYTVTAKFYGGATISRRITLDAGQDLALDLTISANPTISGHVFNQNQEPVAGAFVWLIKPDYLKGRLEQVVTFPVTTDEDGAYTFDSGLETNRRYFLLVDRPPSDELVSAAAPELKERKAIEVPTYYPSATRMDAATPVILQPGEHRVHADIAIASARYFCVDGKIQVGGAPRGSSFAIHDEALAGTRLSLIRWSAGADGKYRACGLAAGTYELSIDQGSMPFTISTSDLHRVDLSADVAHLRVNADWDGDPPPVPEMPKLDAASRAALGKFAAAAGVGGTSDSELQQLALRLIQGDTSLTGSLLAAQQNLDRQTVNDLLAVFVRFRRPTDTLAVTLGNARDPEQHFSGTVPTDRPFRNDRSNPNGGGEIPGGEYTAALSVWGVDDPYIKDAAYDGIPIGDGELRIAPGSAGTLHVVVGRGSAGLIVTVADSDGKPLADASVMVAPLTVSTVGGLARVRTRGQADQNGTFTALILAPGKYRVVAMAQPVRWGVPEDLEKLLSVLFEASTVELGSKENRHITLAPR